MPKGSEELTNLRKEEIINACAALYETMSFKDITLQEIGKKTSFTRTSIYNYFHTKEEIFLALLQREHEAWIEDLRLVRQEHDSMSVSDFACALASTLERRQCMLKLMAMNLYDMEANSRMDNLVAFKKVYGDSMQAITCCLKKFFPSMAAGDIQEFLYALFPFLFGVYPYTAATKKQEEAMALAHVHHARYSICEITESLVIKLLLPFQKPEDGVTL